MSLTAPPINSALPLPHELARLAREHGESALAALTARNIHQTRRLLKRLRAVLRLAADDKAAREMAKPVRAVGRLLSTSRDLEVSRALLPSFEEKLPKSARATLEGILAPNSHNTQLNAAVEQALPIMRETCHALSAWQPDTRWKGLTHGIGSSYHRARRFHHQCQLAMSKASEGSLSGPAAEPLHELRKELKRLGHQLQFLPRAPSSGSHSWLESKKKEAHTISQVLGEEHDLHVFEESLGPHAALLLPALYARRAVLQNEALSQAKHFLKKKPHAFAKKLAMHLLHVREEES